MAEEEDIEMKDLNRPPERTKGREAQEEIGFNNDPLDPNRSIHIIDTSIPNIRRDVGVMKRAYTADKKDFLKKIGIEVNKKDGPNSKSLMF